MICYQFKNLSTSDITRTSNTDKDFVTAFLTTQCQCILTGIVDVKMTSTPILGGRSRICAVIQRDFFNPVLRLQNASLYRSLSANDVPSAQSRVKGHYITAEQVASSVATQQ